MTFITIVFCVLIAVVLVISLMCLAMVAVLWWKCMQDIFDL